MPLGNPLVESVKQGSKRARVEKGTQQRVRRPLTWGILTRMQESVPCWGVGGRVVWIGLALSYFWMLLASVKALVRWATGQRLTNRLPKVSLITLFPPSEQRDFLSSYGAVRAYSGVL